MEPGPPDGASMNIVRRIVLTFVVGLLALSASGVTVLMANEPCTAYELPAGDDGACPPMCVTCGCCAQGVELVTIAAPATAHLVVATFVAFPPDPSRPDPRDILHVPKPVRA